MHGVALATAMCVSSLQAFAADCPGNPDALGTSRTIVVDPTEHRRIGVMQYRETLPLDDHEVVLTFDDGPLPPHTNSVLDTLASQCVKATFFMVGRMAKEFPEAVRRVHAEGHSIGTHSENHPFGFGDMQMERIKSEVEDGIAHVSAALGDDKHLSPFFRIPGLRTSDALESYLAERGLMLWSSDFLADDWRHISSAQVIKLALSRLEARGKGIMLLHDIQKRTQDALPVILRELKSRGYRIVHVEAATPDRPKTPTEPEQWQTHQPFGMTPMARRSMQSIQLAKAPTSSSVPERVLFAPASAFHIFEAAARHPSLPVMSELSAKSAATPQLAGSSRIQPAGMTFGPLTFDGGVAR